MKNLAHIVTLGSDLSASPSRQPIMRRSATGSPAKALGAAFGRLTGLAAAHKLAHGHFVGPAARKTMLAASGLSAAWDNHSLVNKIMAADGNTLGGIVEDIEASVSNVVSKIPFLGPVLTTTAKAGVSEYNAVSNAGAAAMAGHPLDALTDIIGGTVGSALSIVGGAVQGIITAPGQIIADIGGIFSAGKQLIANAFSSSSTAIEQGSPWLSGKLTSIFQGLGAGYTGFKNFFDSISASMKNATVGAYVAAAPDGNFYTMLKDSLGNYTVKQVPAAQISTSVSARIPQGQIVAVPPNTLAAGTAGPAGTAQSSFSGSGVSTPPAGASDMGGAGVLSGSAVPAGGWTPIPTSTDMGGAGVLLNASATGYNPIPLLDAQGKPTTVLGASVKPQSSIMSYLILGAPIAYALFKRMI